MVTFENGIDIRCREPKTPTVAKLRVKGTEYAFVVIGTDYGYIHTTAGDVKTWKSYSGARKAANQYQPI